MNITITPPQLQHKIENGEKLADAKRLEIEAYREFRTCSEDIAALFNVDGSSYDVIDSATYKLLTAWIARAEIELEELDLQTKAMKAMMERAGSMIQVPGIRPA